MPSSSTGGTCTLSWPSSTTRVKDGDPGPLPRTSSNCRMMPRLSVTSAGVLQPSLSAGPDRQRARDDREDHAQLADQGGGVGDRVAGEQDGVEYAGAQPGLQRLDGDTVLQADDAADAVEGEAEAELDGGELAEDQQQQRPAILTSRQLGGEDADRLDRDRAEAELEDPGVLALVGVEEQVAAALDHPSIEREADARRGLEGEVEVRRTEVAASRGEGEGGGRAHPLHSQSEGSQLGAHGTGGLQLEPVGGDGEPEVQQLQLDRAELDVDRDVDGESGAALEVEPPAAGPAGEEVEGHPQAAVGEDRGEEAVGVGEVDDDRAVLDGDLDQHVAVGQPGSYVPAQVAPDGGAQPLCLDPGATRDAEQRHGLPVHTGHSDPDARAARDLGRGGRRVDPQLPRGHQVDRSAGEQVAGESHVQREPWTEGYLDVQLLGEVDPGGGTDPRDGVAGGAEVDHEDAQHRRAAARARLHEGDLGDAVGEPSEPLQQLLPLQVGTPVVFLRKGCERVVEQVVEQVEAEPALDVRRCGRGRGDRATLQQAEQLGDAGDYRVAAFEVVRHQVADQPLGEFVGEGPDLRARRTGSSTVHGIGDPVHAGCHGGDDGGQRGREPGATGATPSSYDRLDQVLDPIRQVANRRRRVTDRVHHAGGAEHDVRRRHPELGEQQSHLSGGEPVLQRLERTGHFERERLDGHGHGWSSPGSSSMVRRGVPVNQATSRGKTRRRRVLRNRGERSTRSAAGGPTLR